MEKEIVSLPLEKRVDLLTVIKVMGSYCQDSSPIISGCMYKLPSGLICEGHRTSGTDNKYANTRVACCAMSNKSFASDTGSLCLPLAFMTL